MEAHSDIYQPTFDLASLTEQQLREYSRHQFTKTFSTGLTIFLHLITAGIFSIIYFGLKHAKLPKIRHDDFGAGRAIGFWFIPGFNLYWVFRFCLRLVDRVNFQLRLRGLKKTIGRGFVLATVIIGVISFPFLVSANLPIAQEYMEGYMFGLPVTAMLGATLVMSTICVGLGQIATNRLAEKAALERQESTTHER
ncbi:MAG: hypothetical protein PHQ43_01630 [Dehalococcoidales bacterium]|nr:hypothetical protein [Dehalococcoidales bacterium]